jgi:hypothetical protein
MSCTKQSTSPKITQFVVEQLKPTIDDYILDPCIGTGGFISATINYLESNYSKEEHTGRIVGYDINTTSVLNYPPNINLELYCADSLKKPANMIYDIIVADPPFGFVNYKNPIELSFLELCLNNLDKGGRCAIIVPNTLLLNNCRHYKKARAKLLTSYNVMEIVLLDKKFFDYTSIDKSIIFFSNSGKTDYVEFYNLDVNMNKTHIFKQHISTIIENNYMLEPIVYASIPIKLSYSSERLLDLLILHMSQADSNEIDIKNIKYDLVMCIGEYLKNRNTSFSENFKKVIEYISVKDCSNFMTGSTIQTLNYRGRISLLDSITNYYKYLNCIQRMNDIINLDDIISNDSLAEKRINTFASQTTNKKQKL